MNIKFFFTHLLHAGKPHILRQKNALSIGRALFRYPLFLLLYGLSLLYKTIVQCRVFLYQKTIFKCHTLSCPVISIGNITVGGTGKTPMTILITQLFRQHGKRVAILSRGYQRRSSGPYCVVQPDADVETVGDEPLLMARTFQQAPNAPPDAVVIVGRQRHLAGRFALEQFRPDVLLLDDGFQHLQLTRNFDLVLIDATHPFGGGHLLPAGFLREPLQNLARAHAFVITRSDEIPDLSPICQRLRQINPNAPIFRGIHTVDKIKRAATGETVDLAFLKTKRLLGVSGLANPASFHRLVERLPLTVGHYLDFPDHHWYTEGDARAIQHTITALQIEAIITTAKDEVKLLRYANRLALPIHIITLKIEVRPQKDFETMLLRLLI